MLKFETKNVGGKVGIFVEKDNKKQDNYKFGYKNKGQRHTLRDPKQPPPNKEAQEKLAARKPWGANNKFKAQEVKPPPAKSRPRPTAPGAQGKHLNNDPNSVTLTQDQLTTILASIGQISNDSKHTRAVEITVDTKDNQVNIKAARADGQENDDDDDDKDSALGEDSVATVSPREEKPSKKKEESVMALLDKEKKGRKKKKETQEERMQRLIDENIGKMTEEELVDLLAQAYLEDQKEEMEKAADKDTAAVERRNARKKREQQREKNKEKLRAEKADEEEKEATKKRGEEKEKLERRRQRKNAEEERRKSEKEVQVKLEENAREKEKEDEKVLIPAPLTKADKLKLKWSQERSELSRLANQGGYDPWGRPGAGAPLSPRYEATVGIVSQLDMVPPTTRVSPRSQASENLPYGINTVLPLAIRSSMVIGDSAPMEDRFVAQREEEKKRWLVDLDRQRQEKLTDRQRQKNPEPQIAMVEPSNVPGLNLSPNASMNSGDMNPYLRGAGLETMHMDRKALAEAEEKRKRQQEHQKAIRDQVEERARQKEEERRRIQEEEQIEERRLARERDVLQAQYENEQKVQRRKQQDEEKRIQELSETFHQAEEQAKLERQMKRLRHLERGGHDTTALRAQITARSLDNVSDRQHYQPPTHRSLEEEPIDADGDRLFIPSPRRPAESHAVQTDSQLLTSLLLDRGREPPRQQLNRTQNLGRRSQASQHHHTHHDRSHEHVEEQESLLTDRSTRPPPGPPLAIHERPEWNARQARKPLKQSERDPNYLKKKSEREQRRKQREAYLLTDINPMTGRAADGSTVIRTYRQAAPVANTQTQRTAQRGRGGSPPVPAIKHKLEEAKSEEWLPSDIQVYETGGQDGQGPLMRTSDVLDPCAATRPIIISRENTARQLARQTYLKGLNPAQFGEPMELLDDRRVEKLLPPRNQYKDPIFNPGVVKDVPTARQDAILAQLSSIRQGLLMKQKEIETSLSMNDSLY